MNTLRRGLSWLSAICGLMIGRVALADDASQITILNPLGDNTTVPSLLDRIFTQGLTILTFVLPIIIIVGAFQMMFSSGDPEEFAKGRKTIVYAAIGFAIVLMAKGITAIIKQILTS